MRIARLEESVELGRSAMTVGPGVGVVWARASGTHSAQNTRARTAHDVDL